MNTTEAYYKKMTETPVPKLILNLGIPTTISMLITNIYNMADTFFVSSLGNSASAAVGVVFGLMAIIQAFGFMFGHGAGSIIARKLGEKDVKSAEKFAKRADLSKKGMEIQKKICYNRVRRNGGKGFLRFEPQ